MPRLRITAFLLLPLLAPAPPAWAQSNLGGAQGQGTLQAPRATAPAPPRPVTPPAVPAPPDAPGARAPRAPAGQTLTLPPRPQNQPAGRAQAPRQAQRPSGTLQAPAGRAPQVRSGTAPARSRTGAAAGAAAGVAAGAALAPQAAPAQPPPEPVPDVGSVTGLPVPRFVALRADEVNLRVGPDTRFPIEWTYQRRDLPVEVLREYNQWRRIRDMDGTEGWVHQSTLAGRRTLVVRGQERELRRDATESSGLVARLQPGVVGRIRRCAAGNEWCEVQVGDLRGYLRRADFWGVKPDEDIN